MCNWREAIGRGVVIFSKQQCPFCVRAKSLFGKIGAPVREVMVDDWPQSDVDLLKLESKHRTFPNIFVNATHVGGYDNLKVLYESKQLFDLFKREGIELSPPGGQKL